MSPTDLNPVPRFRLILNLIMTILLLSIGVAMPPLKSNNNLFFYGRKLKAPKHHERY